jgi:hypothetical protein
VAFLQHRRVRPLCTFASHGRRVSPRDDLLHVSFDSCRLTLLRLYIFSGRRSSVTWGQDKREFVLVGMKMRRASVTDSSATRVHPRTPGVISLAQDLKKLLSLVIRLTKRLWRRLC